MKIFLKLPKLGEQFAHDAPLYGIIKWGLPAFIFISSMTVFAGVKIHAAGFLSSQPTWLALPGYSVAYIIFSLAPDMLNAVMITYIVRSLLNKKFHYTDIILNVMALGMCIFLTAYSFNMSRFSGSTVAEEISEEEEEIDLSKINATYSSEISQIEINFNNDINSINNNYRELIAAEEATTLATINPLKEKILQYERNRKTTNTSWTDSKINKLKSEIANIEKESATKKANLLKEKQSKIDQKTSLKDERIQKLETQKDTDRKTTASLKESANEDKAAATAFLKNQLSTISGFAVFIVLVLASLKEVIHFRNEISPTPILSNLDFQSDWIKEVFAFPFVKAQRNLINNVRTKYEQLPELKDPPPIYDITEYHLAQKVLSPGVMELGEETDDSSFFFGTKSRVPFIAHEKSTKSSDSAHTKAPKCTHEKCTKSTHESEDLKTIKQRLKMYKKRVGEHTQKAKAQIKKDGLIKDRTQAAINNNKSKVAEYEALLRKYS